MKAKKIVLIEDDKVMSGALRAGLTDAGFEVECAFDGTEGLALTLKTKPDLVLLDLLLPKLPGMALARKLKENAPTRNIPIIILTMLDKSEPVAEAMEIGVYQYLLKSDFKIQDVVREVCGKIGRN